MCLLLTLFLFSSCQKEDLAQSLNSVPKSNENQEEFENPEGETVIGERKENPFKVSTMQQAYANLGGTNKGGKNDISIRTTHLYIKFLPQDTADVSILNDLERKNELNLFNYPLDCDVLVPGISYHDPNVPEDMPTPQYTAVEVGYQLPDNIDYEILDNLYLPETDLDSTIEGRENWLDMLEEEAFKLTGNEAELYQQKSKFRPQGFMRVENNWGGISTEGVPYIKITARRWFTLRQAYTSLSGYYFINYEFKGSVNYQMKFTHSFAMINMSPVGTLTAYKDGPKRFGHWDYTSWQGMSSYLWKIIFVGLSDFYNVHAPNYNLPTPPYVKIRAGSANTAYCHMLSTTFGGPVGFFVNDIKIGEKNSTYRNIYRRTVHELAHALHWKMMANDNTTRNYRMINSRQMVREGWACAFTDFTMNDAGLGWRYSQFGNQTTTAQMIADGYPRILGQDLWDNTNQFFTPPGSDVFDIVQGVPLEDVFNALQGVGNTVSFSDWVSMQRWRDNLMQMHPAQTMQILIYFDNYN